MWGWNCQMWEKNKGTTKCDKRTVTCDVKTTQYEDETVKYEKKAREPPNVTKKTIICDKNRADVMLVLLNMKMKPSNLRKTN